MFFIHQFLNPLKKIKYLKDIQKLDRKYKYEFNHFLFQKNLEEEDDKRTREPLPLSTWQIEKKVLYWIYLNKHPLSESLHEENFLLESELYRKRNKESLNELKDEDFENELYKIETKRESLLIKELEEMRRLYKRAKINEKQQIHDALNITFDLIKNEHPKCHLKNMLITQNEILNTNAKTILDNLTTMGFLIKKENFYYIKEKAIKYGEVIFDFYNPKVLNGDHPYTQYYSQKPQNLNRPQEEAGCILKRSIIKNIFFAKLPIFSIYYAIMIIIAALLMYFLNTNNLFLNINLQNITLFNLLNLSTIFVIILVVPFIFIIISLIIGLLNNFINKIRFKNYLQATEDLAEKNKSRQTYYQ